MFGLVGNPKDIFSYDMAHVKEHFVVSVFC